MTGSELRAARMRMLLTQSDLAVLLDVSRPTVSYYETGHAKVPKTVELAIEALLRRQIVDLAKAVKAEAENA